MLLANYFTALPKRWTRLQKQPLWIAANLFHVCGKWGQFWDETKQNPAVSHREIHDYPRTRPLLDLRGLHEQTAKTLSVREQLHVQSHVFTRLLRYTENIGDLAERLRGHLEDIAYHEETSQVILRQLENMTSLVANPDFLQLE